MGNTSGLQSQERSMGRGRGKGRGNQTLNPSTQIQNRGTIDRSCRRPFGFGTDQTSAVSQERREATNMESRSGDQTLSPINPTAAVYQEVFGVTGWETDSLSSDSENSTNLTFAVNIQAWSKATRRRSYNRRHRKLHFTHQLESESGSTQNQTLDSTHQTETAAVSQERTDAMDPNQDLNSNTTTPSVAVSQQKRSNIPRMLLPIKKRIKEDECTSGNAQSNPNQQKMTLGNHFDLNHTDVSASLAQ